MSAALKEAFGFLWVGFYMVREHECELVLGPFQGPVACTRIAYGRGVCGTAWKEGRSIIVDDVRQFPGHIACSSLSRSEIVVPLEPSPGTILGVLDVDSSETGTFDEVDRNNLRICKIVSIFALPIRYGTMAEWLGNGLQNRVQQFDSAWYL